MERGLDQNISADQSLGASAWIEFLKKYKQHLLNLISQEVAIPGSHKVYMVPDISKNINFLLLIIHNYNEAMTMFSDYRISFQLKVTLYICRYSLCICQTEDR